MKSERLLLLTAFIISGCSLCYELIIGAISSYISGDTVWQYSVTIGLYMAAMGFGSYISKYIRRNLYDWFIGIEVIIGIIGGLSATFIFLANLYLEAYQVVMYAFIIGIGILVGMEIPLLARILEVERGDLRHTLSSVFAFDYMGGLAGSVVFPLLFLPHLGYLATAFLCGVLNVAAAGIVIGAHYRKLRLRRIWRAVVIMLTIGLFTGVAFAGNISKYVEGGLYRDTIIFSTQTEYQKIVVTRHKDDVRLFIDGNLQFSSSDEYRYHEALIHVPMAQVQNPQRVLILGGGDGLAARELLKYEGVEITLVDLDKAITDLASTNPVLTKLNEHSLTDPRVTIINDDAFKFLEQTNHIYDVIVIDLPDPNNATLVKLYSNIFYRLCYKTLGENGVMVVQSTSPYYATKTFWSIHKTLESEGFYVYPYHLQVPSFGDWGFNLASKHSLAIIHPVRAVNTRFLTDDVMNKMFVFGKDEIAGDVEINAVTRPVILDYYMDAVHKWR